MNVALVLASHFLYNIVNPSFDGYKYKTLIRQAGQPGNRAVAYGALCTTDYTKESYAFRRAERQQNS